MVDAGAAVLGRNGRAEQADLPHLLHDFLVEPLMAIGHEDARHQLVLGVSARGVANETLLLGQLLVQKERVVPYECLLSFHLNSSLCLPRPGLHGSDMLDDGGDALVAAVSVRGRVCHDREVICGIRVMECR